MKRSIITVVVGFIIGLLIGLVIQHQVEQSQPEEHQAALAEQAVSFVPAGWIIDCVDAHKPASPKVVRQFCAGAVFNAITSTPTDVDPESTPGSTSTPIPTNTARPTFTPTKTPTTDVDASPTPDDEPQPTPNGEEVNCDVKTNTSGIAFRTEHATSAALIDRLTLGQSMKVFNFFDAGSGTVWAQSYDPVYTVGWFMIRSEGVWWINLVEQDGICDNVPGWNDTWKPGVVAFNRAGIHGLGGFLNSYAVLAEIEHFSVLKVTDDAYFVFSEARKLNKGLITVHRNIHLLDVGLRNCPIGYGMGGADQARALARSWFDLVWRTWEARNLTGKGLVTYGEIQNECGWPGAEYENAYWLEILRLANEKGICLALYSDSYGTPEIDQFVSRRPVFDQILKEPCAAGRFHVISLHTYGRVDSGLWIFFRWTLFRDALRAINPKYDKLQFIFTEQGVSNAAGNNDGRGSADCGRAALETQQATAAYQDHPEVVGFALYSFGSGTEWLDLTPCLPQIAASLH